MVEVSQAIDRVLKSAETMGQARSSYEVGVVKAGLVSNSPWIATLRKGLVGRNGKHLPGQSEKIENHATCKSHDQNEVRAGRGLETTKDGP